MLKSGSDLVNSHSIRRLGNKLYSCKNNKFNVIDSLFSCCKFFVSFFFKFPEPKIICFSIICTDHFRTGLKQS